MTQITETSAYERHLLVVEGKSLNEWNKMTKEEREQTESFRFMVETLQNCNKVEIAEQEARLEDPDLVDGKLEELSKVDGTTWMKWKPWNSRGAVEQTIEKCKERNYEESAHERLDEVITRLTEESDDGHFATINIEERHIRGFQIMEDNDWEYVALHYSGGHDEGGVDEAYLLLKDGTEIEMGWDPMELLAACPRILGWQGCWKATVTHEAGMQFFHKTSRTWNNWHNPTAVLATTTDNPFMDSIDDQFGSWAGDWRADGNLNWDNRKKIDGKENPDYRGHPSLEFHEEVMCSEAQSVPI